MEAITRAKRRVRSSRMSKRKKYHLTKNEQLYASRDQHEAMLNVLGNTVYEYQVNEPCPVCGKYNSNIVMSYNPHKTRITPFNTSDTMTFSCGHEVPSLGLTVRRKD